MSAVPVAASVIRAYLRSSLGKAITGSKMSCFLRLMKASIALDRGADVGRGFICEGVHFIFLHLDDTHDIVSLNGDFVGSAVLNDDFAVLVSVDADQ